MPQFCRGGGGECDCERFQPKEDSPTHCWECNHGKSKHPDVEQAVTSSNTTPSNAPSNTASSNTTSDSNGTLSNAAAGTDSLQKYSSSKINNILGTLRSKKVTPFHSEARKEAVQTKVQPARAIDKGKVCERLTLTFYLN